MPIYEYRCQDCNAKFEKLLRRASESTGLVCPSCGQSRLAVELSTFAAHTSASAQRSGPPMCPSGGVCPTPGLCGMN
jgi:putative FmdB family regulatory protein